MHALVAKTQLCKAVRWCPDGNFGEFLRPLFPASRVQHISDLHSKFVLRPYRVSSIIDIQRATTEIGEKK